MSLFSELVSLLFYFRKQAKEGAQSLEEANRGLEESDANVARLSEQITQLANQLEEADAERGSLRQENQVLRNKIATLEQLPAKKTGG